MRRIWKSSLRTPILLSLGPLAADLVFAQLLGVKLLPDIGGAGGLVLLWGIGHCDTLDGPVVTLAKQALDQKNLNLVLPWVRPEDEDEIRRAFDVHRVGEGANSPTSNLPLRQPRTLRRIERPLPSRPLRGRMAA